MRPSKPSVRQTHTTSGQAMFAIQKMSNQGPTSQAEDWLVGPGLSSPSLRSAVGVDMERFQPGEPITWSERAPGHGFGSISGSRIQGENDIAVVLLLHGEFQ